MDGIVDCVCGLLGCLGVLLPLLSDQRFPAIRVGPTAATAQIGGTAIPHGTDALATRAYCAGTRPAAMLRPIWMCRAGYIAA